MKKHALIICFLLSSVWIFAQQQKRVKLTSLSWSPLGAVDIFDANATFGAELSNGGEWSFGADLGYVYASIYYFDSRSTRGLLARPFIRRYFSPKHNYFAQMQLHYKHVSYTAEEWVNQNVVNGLPSFSRLENVDRKKEAMGVHLLFGNRERLIKNNNHVQVETTLGLGYRYKTQDFGRENLNDGWAFGTKGGISTGVFLINVKLCYVF